MRKIIRLIGTALVLALLLLVVVSLAPRLVHICDNCDKFFLGTGYSANMISDTITFLSGQDDKILCADCAAQEHAFAIAAGKKLEEFRIPLFPNAD